MNIILFNLIASISLLFQAFTHTMDQEALPTKELLLLSAIRSKTEDAACAIIASGDIDVNRDINIYPFGVTTKHFLHFAVEYNLLRVCTCLLDGGAEIHPGNYSGRTPLHRAASCGFYDMTVMLLNRGACIDKRDDIGYTPLHEAAEYGHADIVELLCRLGSEVDVRAGDLLTPLALAMASTWFKEDEHAQVAHVLCTYKANPNIVCHNGLTPLYLAVAYKKADAVEVLLKNGADLHVRVMATYPKFPTIHEIMQKYQEMYPRHEKREQESSMYRHDSIATQKIASLIWEYEQAHDQSRSEQ